MSSHRSCSGRTGRGLMLYRWDGAGGASCAAPHGRSRILRADDRRRALHAVMMCL